jgi:hypothetical protein
MTHPQARGTTLTLPRHAVDTYAGLEHLLARVPAAHDVDLRFVVPERHRHAVLTALGSDPVGVLIRQVAFVDTDGLALHRAGVAIRLRRTQHQAPDLTVTLRSADFASLPADVRGLPEVEIAVEASLDGPTTCCSATSTLPGRRARDVLGGRLGVDQVMTGPQRDLLGQALPGGLPLGELTVLGPFHVLRSRFVPTGYPRRLVAEQWFLPDGARILELTTRCTAGLAPGIADETRRFLARHGVDLDEPHAHRTGAALATLAVRLPVALAGTGRLRVPGPRRRPQEAP